jgi:hypothetical protein
MPYSVCLREQIYLAAGADRKDEAIITILDAILLFIRAHSSVYQHGFEELPRVDLGFSLGLSLSPTRAKLSAKQHS